MRLIVIRHGETFWNTQRRFLGHTDMALNANGEAQAVATGEQLAGLAVDALYSSDLTRTRQTAESINQPHQLEIQFDPRLRELNFGDWEGMNAAEIKAHDAERFAQWQSDPNNPPPNGESLTACTARLKAFWDDLWGAYHEEETVIVVTHKGSARLLLCLLLGLPSLKYSQFHLDPAALTEIYVYEGGILLTKFNDTSHLPAE